MYLVVIAGVVNLLFSSYSCVFGGIKAKSDSRFARLPVAINNATQVSPWIRMECTKCEQAAKKKLTSLSLAAVSLVAGLPSASPTSVEAFFALLSALTAAVVIADAPINEFGVVASVLAIVCANGMTSSSSSSSAMLSMTSGLLSAIDTGVVRPLFGAESATEKPAEKLFTNEKSGVIAEIATRPETNRPNAFSMISPNCT